MNNPPQESMEELFTQWYWNEGNAPETTSGDMVHDMAKIAFLAGLTAQKERIQKMLKKVDGNGVFHCEKCRDVILAALEQI